MIKKTIHYIWLGGNEKSEIVQGCIESWRNVLTEYEIIEWNENNFDIQSNIYLSEAYSQKKWAFAADYIRLRVLYENGGIYLDTDVKVLKNFDAFLDNDVFLFFENQNLFSTAIIGCEAGNRFIKALLDIYEHRHFIDNQKMNYITINTIMTDAFVEFFFLKRLANTNKNYGEATAYKKKYLAKETKRCKKNAVALHLFLGSWHDSQKTKDLKVWGKRCLTVLKNFFKAAMHMVLGYRLTRKLIDRRYAKIIAKKKIGYIK